MKKLELIMITLTDTQMSVLASACQRADGLATRPHALNRTAAAKVAAKMIENALVQEVAAKLDDPIWRMDEECRVFSLKVTKAGREIARRAANVSTSATQDTKQIDIATGAAAAVALESESKPGTKRNLILALLRRDQGATIQDLMTATGWLPHTTRAALSGLRKAGLDVSRSCEGKDRASIYKIEQATVPSVACQ